MARQARGRARKRKSGLIKPKVSAPLPDDLRELQAEIVKDIKGTAEYLRRQLQIFDNQSGMHKEVMSIGSALCKLLNQLRSLVPDRSEGDDDAPSARSFHSPPPL